MLNIIIMKKIKKILMWIHRIRGYPMNDKKVISIIKKQLKKYGKENVEVKTTDIVLNIARHFDEDCIVFSFYYDRLYYLVYLDGETRVISEPTAEILLVPCLVDKKIINRIRVDFDRILKIKYKNGHFNARICKIPQNL